MTRGDGHERGGEPVMALAEVDRLRRDHDPDGLRMALHHDPALRLVAPKPAAAGMIEHLNPARRIPPVGQSTLQTTLQSGAPMPEQIIGKGSITRAVQPDRGRTHRLQTCSGLSTLAAISRVARDTLVLVMQHNSCITLALNYV